MEGSELGTGKTKEEETLSTIWPRVKDTLNQDNSSGDGENWTDLRVIHEQN